MNSAVRIRNGDEVEKILTVVILTKDEEENIVDCITNAKQVTEDVLVIDSGSEDATVELAKSVGARVVYRAWDDDFSAQRNFAIENSDAEWLFYLDADERLSEELVQSVREAINGGDCCYSMPRKAVAFGQLCSHGVLRPDKVTRLFKRTHFKYVNKVHERPECSDPCKELKGYLEHYTYTDWHRYFIKFNQYTTLWAENAYAKGKRTNYFAAIGHGLFGFIQMAFLKGGILDSWIGFVLSINHFFYTYMKYVKLIDLQRKNK